MCVVVCMVENEMGYQEQRKEMKRKRMKKKASKSTSTFSKISIIMRQRLAHESLVLVVLGRRLVPLILHFRGWQRSR